MGQRAGGGAVGRAGSAVGRAGVSRTANREGIGRRACRFRRAESGRSAERGRVPSPRAAAAARSFASRESHHYVQPQQIQVAVADSSHSCCGRFQPQQIVQDPWNASTACCSGSKLWPVCSLSSPPIVSVPCARRSSWIVLLAKFGMQTAELASSAAPPPSSVTVVHINRVDNCDEANHRKGSFARSRVEKATPAC